MLQHLALCMAIALLNILPVLEAVALQDLLHTQVVCDSVKKSCYEA